MAMAMVMVMVMDREKYLKERMGERGWIRTRNFELSMT